MKKSIFYTFALSCLLAFALSSCRPARELNHSVDFSSVIESVHRQNETLAEQLRQSENRQSQSLDTSTRSVTENEHRRENENVVIREFDTTQPDNPILRETIIERVTSYELQVTSYEVRDIVTELFESILIERETEYQNQIDNLLIQHSALREEIKVKEIRARGNLIIGIFVGFVIAIAFVTFLIWLFRKAT